MYLPVTTIRSGIFRQNIVNSIVELMKKDNVGAI